MISSRRSSPRSRRLPRLPRCPLLGKHSRCLEHLSAGPTASASRTTLRYQPLLHAFGQALSEGESGGSGGPVALKEASKGPENVSKMFQKGPENCVAYSVFGKEKGQVDWNLAHDVVSAVERGS